MKTISKRILLGALVMAGLACAASTKAQVTVQWERASGDLKKVLGLKQQFPEHLVSMDFVDDQTGFLTTHDGGVIRTDDGGLNWRLLYETDPQHGDYFFLNKNVWFSGPSLYQDISGRTLDVGKHWEYFENRECYVGRPFFLNKDVGWGVFGFSVCTTKDGGKTWSVVAKAPGRFNSLNSIFMLDGTHGWVAGDRIILATVDGSQWFPQLQDPSLDVKEIHFLDRNIGYAKVTGTGLENLKWHTLLHSKDGGQHWERSAWNGSGINGLPRVLSNCVIQGERDIWVIGDYDKTQGSGPSATQAQYSLILFHSGDGAASFQSVSELRDSLPRPVTISLATQQGKSVLLMLGANGELWRTFIPASK